MPLVQDYPELAEPHNNLAALYAAAGDYGKARAELEEALRLNPLYAPAHENLGDVYALLAGQSYARALRLEPASVELAEEARAGAPAGRDRLAAGGRAGRRRRRRRGAESRPFRSLQPRSSFRCRSLSRASLTVLVAALAFAASAPALAQKVRFVTSAGDIVVELDAAKAPKTVANFLAVREGRPLRRHDLPPRHRQLHDPGRRHDARHEGEADPAADRPREPATA